MKIIKQTVFLLAMAIAVAGCSSSEETNSGDDEQLTLNQVANLPWLKEIIDGLEKDAEAGYKQHARIYQCEYKDGIGFLLELCVGCPDYGYWLKSYEGESLCVMWGHAGDSGTEWGVDFENKKLIWEINK